MYSTCTFCYGALGTNQVLETFSVSRRVAFDPRKACLWAVCPLCARWNLAPLDFFAVVLGLASGGFVYLSLRLSGKLRAGRLMLGGLFYLAFVVAAVIVIV